MASFERAIGPLLKAEGGYVNHPNDKGGATNFGISLKTYRTVDPEATEDTIKALTRDKAVAYYRQYWWNVGPYALLHDQTLANKLFVTAVNLGTVRMTRLLQRTINGMERLQTPLVIDGRFGPKTIAAVNALHAAQVEHEFTNVLIDWYRWLVIKDPSQKVFLNGWIERAKKTYEPIHDGSSTGYRVPKGSPKSDIDRLMEIFSPRSSTRF